MREATGGTEGSGSGGGSGTQEGGYAQNVLAYQRGVEYSAAALGYGEASLGYGAAPLGYDAPPADDKYGAAYSAAGVKSIDKISASDAKNQSMGTLFKKVRMKPLPKLPSGVEESVEILPMAASRSSNSCVIDKESMSYQLLDGASDSDSDGADTLPSLPQTALQEVVTICWSLAVPGIVKEVCVRGHSFVEPGDALVRVDVSPQLHRAIYLQAADRSVVTTNRASQALNVEFQSLSEKLVASMVSGAFLTDRSETLETCKKLEGVVRDFMETARTYGRVIINELGVPYEDKTIRPLGMGGVLGGEKFLVRGVLFKTPKADSELFKQFGESKNRDEMFIAHKVQGHELKGLKAYFGWFFQRGLLGKVSFPLTALIDFKGYRITAMTLLPIDKNSLVYGSQDAGSECIVKDEIPEWSALVREASMGMGLKPHWVRNGAGEREIASCVDLEGHKGKDGRMYLIDFSRALPPAAKDKEALPVGDRCLPSATKQRRRSNAPSESCVCVWGMSPRLAFLADPFSRLRFLGVSAKTGTHIDELFRATVHMHSRHFEVVDPPRKRCLIC